MGFIGDIINTLTGSAGSTSIQQAQTPGAWQLVRDSSGTIWLTKAGVKVPYGVQSIRIPSAGMGDPGPFGPALSRALAAIGATGQQAQGIQQSVDSGAIMQGGNKVGEPLNQPPGTTLPQFGQRPSASEAVPVGPQLSGISDLIQSVQDFLSYIAWLFHPLNFLRAAEFLLGIIVAGYGVWLLTSRSGRGLGRAVTAVPVVGRTIRVAQGTRMGRHEGQREAARMRARQRETLGQRQESARERERINLDARQSVRNS